MNTPTAIVANPSMSSWRWSSSASGAGHSRASTSRGASLVELVPRRRECARVRARAFTGFFEVVLRVAVGRRFLVVLIPRNFDADPP